ncbi:Uncharacterized protein BM_BM17541 [Brugia malayi]|uniref:Saposin B-type domain-containing protein n=1 Tax=Brugia malayi TaxID=6279 RepID=A0A4E9FER3_BRUMA|nr:Uncharacterized protein BM_BM17541 [Brugia malayi]VIO94734.1 Uncharacterized protein BM_BM17541 [Brugia malayi]
MNLLLLSLLIANFAYILANEKEPIVGLIPVDIICPFCIALIEKFQQTTQENSSYKHVLCESVSAKNHKNYDSCIESFNEITVEKLKNSNAEDLCKEQKICPINYKKVILVANTGKADFPTIPVVTNEQLKEAQQYDTLKTVTDILSGNLKNSNGKNLTLHIDLQFQKLQPDEMATTANYSTMQSNST